MGAVVSAILWQIALTLHVRFQLGVAGYNALYAALGAIPIFLVWTYFSWLIVLLGADIAASHQNEHLACQQFHSDRLDQDLREILAVITAAELAHDFLEGVSPRSAAAIPRTLEVPSRVVEEICDALSRAGFLLEVAARAERTFVVCRDLDTITMTHVRDAVRRQASTADARVAIEQRIAPELVRVLVVAEREWHGSQSNRTLRQLGEMARSR